MESKVRILSVSELTEQIKSLLIQHFINICVEGEISNLTKHQSGHYYFTLKDDNASIKCVLFKGARAKIKLNVEDSLKVQVSGSISVYASRGEYQIICNNIVESGLGNLALRFEELKEKLKNKGYFESSFKKAIPSFPKRVALITSITGAVLQDMKFVAQKRWNLVSFSIFDTLVQGNEAKYKIAENIKLADKMGFDIIVIARGGGSLEDLWAFNEEIVAEAIFSAKTPIVSAIGHETDIVLSDFVADRRAPTPSACIEMILPDKNEWLLKLNDNLNELDVLQKQNLNRFKYKLDSLKSEISHFRFDYVKLKENLLTYKNFLNSFISSMLENKIEMTKNLKRTMGFNYSNITPLKMQNLHLFKEKLVFSTMTLLNLQESKIPKKEILDNLILTNFSKKNLMLEHLKVLLESKNPSKMAKYGFVQITLNGKVKLISDLKTGDSINLSDGKITKEAIIK